MCKGAHGTLHTDGAIAFDKTGTLTYGCLDVSDVLPFDRTVSRERLLSLAASAEAKSEYPLGKAITASLFELLTPTTGALIHNAGSCFVVLIAALLYDRKIE